jgi:hypothetical protein
VPATGWQPAVAPQGASRGFKVDKLFRFSDYDLFGYLAAGIIVFGLCDFIVGTQLVLKDSWSIHLALPSFWVVM